MNIVDSFVGSDGLAAAREAGSRGAVICVAFPQLSSDFSRHNGLRRWVWGGGSRADGARARGAANLAREAETARLPLRVRTLPSSALPPRLGPGPLRAPDRTPRARASVLSPLPAYRRVARRATCVRLIGWERFLPGRWSFDPVTCRKVRWVGGLLLALCLHPFSPASWLPGRFTPCFCKFSSVLASRSAVSPLALGTVGKFSLGLIFVALATHSCFESDVHFGSASWYLAIVSYRGVQILAVGPGRVALPLAAGRTVSH